MVKYRLTKITPDYDEPGVFDLTTQEFRSFQKVYFLPGLPGDEWKM